MNGIATIKSTFLIQVGFKKDHTHKTPNAKHKATAPDQ